MNCGRLRGILPELAAGELDARASAEAREHLSACPACAEELRKFEVALNALSSSFEQVPVPAALDVLHLPERAPNRWLRTTFTCGMAVLFLAAVLVHTLPIQEESQPAPAVVQEIPVEPEIETIEIAEPETIQPEVRQPSSKRQPARTTRQPRRMVVAKAPKVEEVRPEILEESPVPQEIVIVSEVSIPLESYSIEIETKDLETGTTYVYCSKRDESGEQEIGIISNIGI